MDYLRYILGAVLLMFVAVEKSNAIKCYQCNSAHDKRCIGDANNQLTEELNTECPDDNKSGKTHILCRKIKQVIDFEVNGLPPDNRVIRGCGWDDSSYSDRCYQRSGFGGRQEVCACKDNGCNSAASVVGSVFLVFFGILLAA